MFVNKATIIVQLWICAGCIGMGYMYVYTDAVYVCVYVCRICMCICIYNVPLCVAYRIGNKGFSIGSAWKTIET